MDYTGDEKERTVRVSYRQTTECNPQACTETAKKTETAEEAYKKFFLSDEARPLISMLPNAKDIVERLRRRYALAIFTNSSAKTVRRDLSELDLNNFSCIMSEDDVKNKKPSGEGIAKTMNKLGIGPERTYYIGGNCSITCGKTTNPKTTVVENHIQNR